MSHSLAPAGAIVGEIPLNVIGPPCTIVIVPVVNRVLSPFDVATIVKTVGVVVTVVLVGNVVGAV